MRCKLGIAAVVLTLATVLSGCKESTTTADVPESNAPINSPPTIAGSPPTDAVTGTLYSFTPAASDPDGDSLTFSIRNIPSWAAFDDTTGDLFGIPGVGDEGTYTDIQIEASDGVVTASLSKFFVTVRTETPPNSTPVISGTPMTTVDVGMNYTFTPIASDADGDELSFTIQNLPGWAVFDTVRGTLSGVPQSTDEGIYSDILIAVSDGIDSSSLYAFSITVNPQVLPNNAPSISGSPVATVEVGTSYVFTPVASDVDGDPLTFSIRNLPHWAAFDIQSGTLSGVPQSGDEGIYSNIQIEVGDGIGTASLEPFSVTVNAIILPNSAPAISGVPDTVVEADTSYSFAPVAVDAENNLLFFMIENPPAWASFDSATGLLSGTPQSANEGTYTNIVITVSDGDLTASLPAFSITVNPKVLPNNAPTISGTPVATVEAGTTYVFTPIASDVDGDPLTFSIQNRPNWAVFDTQSGTLSGVPQSDDEGVYSNIQIEVGDGIGTASLEPFSVTVTAIESSNSAPAISGVPDTVVEADTSYSFVPVAVDAENDPLFFIIENRPAWASFDSATGLLSGTPKSTDEGTYTDIVITVSDGDLTASLPAFSITVNPKVLPNNAPTISGTPVATVEAGTTYVFTPIASDVDGDPLTFSIQNLPHWAAFDTQSGTLSGVPQSDDEGVYSNIQIEVGDGIGTASLEPFSVTVTAIELSNSAPAISGVPDTLIEADTSYSFAPVAVDAENDPLFFIIENPPAWASFDGATGLLSGTPQSTDEGTYTDIVITVSDGDLTASLPAFSITVNAAAVPARAFPGAEGFGAMSKGGRGGDVYIVTNLDNAGTGSLRWAIDQFGPRTVVFATSGVIALTSQLSIDNPFITIAAQTSPAGITLKGGRVKIRTHDVVIRGLRVRPGDGLDGMEPGNRDGLSIGDQNNPVYNVIIDHSSFTWAVDENGSNWFPSNNVTVQWSLFAEGLRNSIHPEGPHSMGYLIGSGTQNLSVHHNIFASNEHRNPVVADARSVEVVNNVGYNWRSEGVAVGSEGATTLHAINNYYVHGPDTTVRPAFYLRPSEFDQHHIYLSGNVDSQFRPSISSGDEWDVAHGWVPEMRSNDPVFDASGITVNDAVSALSLVLESAGAISPERDSIDARIVNNILTNTGAIIDSQDQVGGYHLPAAIAPPTDTDLDGMPDTWEDSQGLDPEDASDSVDDRDGDGYTELEEYLNSFFQL